MFICALDSINNMINDLRTSKKDHGKEDLSTRWQEDGLGPYKRGMVRKGPAEEMIYEPRFGEWEEANHTGSWRGVHSRQRDESFQGSQGRSMPGMFRKNNLFEQSEREDWR